MSSCDSHFTHRQGSGRARGAAHDLTSARARAAHGARRTRPSDQARAGPAAPRLHATTRAYCSGWKANCAGYATTGGATTRGIGSGWATTGGGDGLHGACWSVSSPSAACTVRWSRVGGAYCCCGGRTSDVTCSHVRDLSAREVAGYPNQQSCQVGARRQRNRRACGGVGARWRGARAAAGGGRRHTAQAAADGASLRLVLPTRCSGRRRRHDHRHGMEAGGVEPEVHLHAHISKRGELGVQARRCRAA